MIKLFDNILSKFHQKRLAMRGCYEQDWRITRDPMPIRAFTADITETLEIKTREQVRYDLELIWGRKMYSTPANVDAAAESLFETVRHSTLGDVIADVYAIRSYMLAGSPDESLRAVEQLLKDLGER